MLDCSLLYPLVCYCRDGDDGDGESFHLLATDGDESDADLSEQKRNSALRAKRSLIHYIEHAMESGETLSSLALQYNCSVSFIGILFLTSIRHMIVY